MGVFPDFTSLSGITELQQLGGALLTIVLILAVLTLIVSATAWALATSHGNAAVAAKGRVGVLVGLGAAVLAGAGVAWINWLITLGQHL